MNQNRREDSDDSVKIPRSIKFDWTWRIVCFLLLILNLWVKSNYVSIADYRMDRRQTEEEMKRMSELLIKMEEDNKVNARQDDTLKDHEARIRILERH